ncbi:hypothetical protein JXA80_02895, partial [bacterium]|nr:hypothetical protein [candidate division CSSED10-310 bacterium]
MNQAWRIGILDVRLLLSDPGAIVQMLVFPILFTWVFGLSFGGGSNQPQALPLIVDNRDAGPLGQTLVNWLPASDVRVLDPADSPGDTPNFRLVIPDDFTTSVVDHPPGHVELIVPPKTSALRVQSLKVAFTQAQIRTLATLTRTRPESATAW